MIDDCCRYADGVVCLYVSCIVAPCAQNKKRATASPIITLMQRELLKHFQIKTREDTTVVPYYQGVDQCEDLVSAGSVSSSSLQQDALKYLYSGSFVLI
jgi:hypothetical protein